MGLPSNVDGREVVVGGGVHGLVYCATRVACGFRPPILIEKRKKTGGVFADVANFRMNSANGASVESVAAGPTRIPSRSPSEDLNWLPNAPYQLRDESGSEYPYSYEMAKTIQRGLGEVAEVYTDAEIYFDRTGACYTPDKGITLGRAQRVLFAGGLVEPVDLPKGPAIMSGYAFMKKPVRDLAGVKTALIGGGDTAAQCAEIMLGQGIQPLTSQLDALHWYGGELMPASKESWMMKYHARFSGVGRGLRQSDSTTPGVIRPYLERGSVTSMGSTAMVNFQVYDLAIMATGLKPALCPVAASSVWRAGGMVVARYYDYEGAGDPRVFRIGTAAQLSQPYVPYRTRFPAAQEAIYNLAPRTAMLAATLP